MSLAQNRIQFGLAPAMIVEEFKPGEAFSLELQLTNGNPAPILMRGLTQDFWYDSKNQNQFGPPGTLPQSASNWVEFVPPQVVVPANGSIAVRLVVTPPVGATGSFYTVAFLESRPELTETAHEGKKALYTNIRLGSLMLFSAEKSAKFSVELSDAKVTPPSSDTGLNLDFTLTNTSNTHIFPRPSVLILDKDNHVVGKAKGEAMRFLPGQHRTLSVPWSGSLNPGDYKALLNLTYGDDKTLSSYVAFSVPSVEANAAPPTGTGATTQAKPAPGPAQR